VPVPSIPGSKLIDNEPFKRSVRLWFGERGADWFLKLDHGIRTVPSASIVASPLSMRREATLSSASPVHTLRCAEPISGGTEPVARPAGRMPGVPVLTLLAVIAVAAVLKLTSQRKWELVASGRWSVRSCSDCSRASSARVCAHGRRPTGLRRADRSATP
jgi:hypothetical protein